MGLILTRLAVALAEIATMIGEKGTETEIETGTGRLGFALAWLQKLRTLPKMYLFYY